MDVITRLERVGYVPNTRLRAELAAHPEWLRPGHPIHDDLTKVALFFEGTGLDLEEIDYDKLVAT